MLKFRLSGEALAITHSKDRTGFWGFGVLGGSLFQNVVPKSLH